MRPPIPLTFPPISLSKIFRKDRSEAIPISGTQLEKMIVAYAQLDSPTDEQTNDFIAVASSLLKSEDDCIKVIEGISDDELLQNLVFEGDTLLQIRGQLGIFGKRIGLRPRIL